MTNKMKSSLNEEGCSMMQKIINNLNSSVSEEISKELLPASLLFPVATYPLVNKTC